MLSNLNNLQEIQDIYMPRPNLLSRIRLLTTPMFVPVTMKRDTLPARFEWRVYRVEFKNSTRTETVVARGHARNRSTASYAANRCAGDLQRADAMGIQTQRVMTYYPASHLRSPSVLSRPEYPPSQTRSYWRQRKKAQQEGKIWSLTLEEFRQVWQGEWARRRRRGITMQMIDANLGYIMNNVYLRNAGGAVVGMHAPRTDANLSETQSRS